MIDQATMNQGVINIVKGYEVVKSVTHKVQAIMLLRKHTGMDYDPNAIDEETGSSLLALAVKEGEAMLVQNFLIKGADVNFAGEAALSPFSTSGYNPLQMAVHFQHVEIVKLLLDNRASTEVPYIFGETPLMKAVRRMDANQEVIDLLIDAKANVNHIGEYGYTPLMWALEDGNIDIITKLIDAGADVDHVAEHDRSVVQHAIWCAPLDSRLDIVKLLIAKGASVDESDIEVAGMAGSRMGYEDVSGAIREFLEAHIAVSAANHHEDTISFVGLAGDDNSDNVE